jgi:hypothetical protein
MYLSEYEADWDATVNPFFEKTETILAGWVLNMHFTQKFDYNRCVLPETSFIPTPPIFGLTWEEVQLKWIEANKHWNNI